jgi:hypothetical protein
MKSIPDEMAGAASRYALDCALQKRHTPATIHGQM